MATEEGCLVVDFRKLLNKLTVRAVTRCSEVGSSFGSHSSRCTEDHLETCSWSAFETSGSEVFFGYGKACGQKVIVASHSSYITVIDR